MKTLLCRALFRIRAALFLSVVLGAGGVDTRADEAGDTLGRELAVASGAEAWKRVKRVEFTFNVEVGGESKMQARHVWDVAAGLDTVTVNGVATTVDVRGGAPAEGPEKAAYARWVNDAYWLLMPLKVLDPGVNRSALGTVEFAGKPHEALQLTFGEVGLTPKDRYVIYIEPDTRRLAGFDHINADGKKRTALRQGQTEVGDMVFATDFAFAGPRIFLTDLKVE